MNEVACEHWEERDEPINVTYVIRKPKKKRPDTTKVVERIISLLLGPLVAITALVFSLNPTLNRRNMNYEQRAQAGDIKAQMFLADYYYQSDDINRSIFYYLMVLERSKTVKSNAPYDLMAYNNLGYIYANVLEDNERAEQYFERGWKAINSDNQSFKAIGKNYLHFRINNYEYDDFHSSSLWHLENTFLLYLENTFRSNYLADDFWFTRFGDENYLDESDLSSLLYRDSKLSNEWYEFKLELLENYGIVADEQDFYFLQRGYYKSSDIIKSRDLYGSPASFDQERFYTGITNGIYTIAGNEKCEISNRLTIMWPRPSEPSEVEKISGSKVALIGKVILDGIAYYTYNLYLPLPYKDRTVYEYYSYINDANTD